MLGLDGDIQSTFREGETLPYPPDAEAMELALQSEKQG